MKNSVNKNDKKKRKEVMAQIEELQEQLKKQQLKEIQDCEEHDATEAIGVNEEQKVETNGDEIEFSGLKYRETRISKAQKKKEKKLQKDKERQHRIETEDVSHLKQSKVRENELIKDKIKELRLKIFDIPSDGNCLYSAVQHQLELHEISTTVKELRTKTSEFIRHHKDQFLPFLIDEESGNMMSEQQIEQYCNEIESTAAWGGNLELQSLAQVLERKIEVIQSDGPILTFGEQFDDRSKITLSYHRHAFSLGEHYNSLIPI